MFSGRQFEDTTYGGAKPNKCNQCDYASLRMHKMIHSGEKPNKCTQCKFACIQKGNLARHMKIHVEKNLINAKSAAMLLLRRFT